MSAGGPHAHHADADLALAGPRRYPGEVVDDAWMGEGRSDLGADDLLACLHLYLAAGALIGVALATLAVLD